MEIFHVLAPTYFILVSQTFLFVQWMTDVAVCEPVGVHACDLGNSEEPRENNDHA